MSDARTMLWAAGLCVAGPPAMHAQTPLTLRADVHVAGVDLTEVDRARAANGLGFGATVTVQSGVVTVEGSALRAALAPASGPSFRVLQWDLRAGYALIPGLAVETGIGRRSITPAFAAQDVGMARLGARTELALSQRAAVWGRGAYLVAPHFDGGGSGGLSLELAFGAGMSTPDGRFRVRADYEFERFDRTVNGVALPIQMGVARVGFEGRWSRPAR